jgi:hypothetical protein
VRLTILSQPCVPTSSSSIPRQADVGCDFFHHCSMPVYPDAIPPGLLATQVSPIAAPKNRTQDSRDFYTRADHASSPMHASGMLAV